MRLPPLKALPVFEAVARLNSFSRAAEELRVSQSAVSHRIKQLEEYLGEPLFVRGGRKLALTEEGQQYLEAVSAALTQIERASEKLQGRGDTQLRLAVFSSFAVRWLIPRLPDLQRRHPALELMLEMTDHSPALSERVADAFITLQGRHTGFSSDLLYSERLFPICSRQFWQSMRSDLQQAGMIDTETPARIDAAWLTRYPLLSASSILGQPAEDWRVWLAAGGCGLPASARMQHFSHMLLAHAAARYHQGIALTNDYMIDPTDHPDMVILPCYTVKTGDEFRFAYKTSRRNEPGIRALKEWLQQQASASGLRRG
ncbi:LysR family transcriptional regulator [Aquisalimonas sp.]|uniref:LysR family transcriptional regulator n=1 Tax=Aquisalimonas sp. TaxID=1872621 RepID=UPI0025C409F0|nr:LysR family transcriptional regulator [Aquisalimonas sp.]